MENLKNLIAIPVDGWSPEQRNNVCQWFTDMGYPVGYPRWYFDDQFRCSDLVMSKEIFFMYQMAFGKVSNGQDS